MNRSSQLGAVVIAALASARLLARILPSCATAFLFVMSAEKLWSVTRLYLMPIIAAMST